MPTSNRRTSISTSREILILKQKSLRFRSIWRWWTRETPWICGRGNSRHRGRELIFSLSRDWRVFHLHLMLIFIPISFWTGIKSGRVLFKRINTPLINTVRCLSSGRSTWKKAINFGWRLVILVQTRICMTAVATWPISRVSCWRRKLWSPFEVQLHRRRTTLFAFCWDEHFCLTSTRKFGEGGNFKGGEGRNSFDSNSFRNRNFFAKIEL